MPPTIPLFLAVLAYVSVACVVWIVAGFLAIPSSTRTLGKKIACAMAGSFPGVILFQILSVPVFLLAILNINIIGLAGRPPNLILVPIALFVVCIPLLASLLGFYTGWRVAWELAAGRSARLFLQTDAILGPFMQFLTRRFPLLDKWLR